MSREADRARHGGEADRLLTLVDQAPGLVSMATDTVDDAFPGRCRGRVDVDARLRAALQIAEKLTAPDMMERLNRLLLGLVAQGPGPDGYGCRHGGWLLPSGGGRRFGSGAFCAPGFA